jgi:hypothetical protein
MNRPRISSAQKDEQDYMRQFIINNILKLQINNDRMFHTPLHQII